MMLGAYMSVTLAGGAPYVPANFARERGLGRPAVPRIASPRAGLLTVREVAERLGVCTVTVYALCERGELEHIRVCNIISFALRPRRWMPSGSGGRTGAATARGRRYAKWGHQGRETGEERPPVRLAGCAAYAPTPAVRPGGATRSNSAKASRQRAPRRATTSCSHGTSARSVVPGTTPDSTHVPARVRSSGS